MPINAQILADNLNPSFVETGTYLGEGVEAAIQAGFEHIWTVDLEDSGKWSNSNALTSHPGVVYGKGDSALFLADLVPQITTPVTFWLDAHPVGYFQLLQPDLPLVKELLAISFRSRHAYDIVLIDDLRLFTPVDQTRLREFITLLWPGCQIETIDSSILPQDILRITNMHHTSQWTPPEQ